MCDRCCGACVEQIPIDRLQRKTEKVHRSNFSTGFNNDFNLLVSISVKPKVLASSSGYAKLRPCLILLVVILQNFFALRNGIQSEWNGVETCLVTGTNQTENIRQRAHIKKWRIANQNFGCKPLLWNLPDGTGMTNRPYIAFLLLHRNETELPITRIQLMLKRGIAKIWHHCNIRSEMTRIASTPGVSGETETVNPGWERTLTTSPRLCTVRSGLLSGLWWIWQPDSRGLCPCMCNQRGRVDIYIVELHLRLRSDALYGNGFEIVLSSYW